jgi:hypothetical protein
MAGNMRYETVPAVSRGGENMRLHGRTFLSFFAAGLLLLLAPTRGFTAEQQVQSEQQEEQTKSISGKVASITGDKKSVTLEVNDGNDKHTMVFTVNQNTRVTGRVSTGSMATVQYRPVNDNEYLALVISPLDTQ